MSEPWPPELPDALELLLRWRRDVRHFRDTPLPEPVVADLLRLAQLAPSVGNAQPWRYVRVRSAGVRAALAEHADEEVAKAGRRYGDPLLRARYAALKLHGLREAPEILAVFCDEEGERGRRLGAVTMPEALRYSVVLSIHTLWLAARARGIGLGWVSVLRPDHVATLLGVPTAWTLVGLLCLGHAEAADDRPELERRGWQDRAAWQENVHVV
ncbi:5,6-dimethylbenzimidazole synthase [Rhizorhabdus phycosphaerae]|uniref:5,6-dimethylbenzimidazole synthase n=1 Tax=Rhizorhabdus phycosphaerae TaxID=2711156 RepID=UPI0013E9A4E8|nr:5,6-dimethylbenzimidazole synthase [Rhizorhabdus phycosphaerae]